MMGGEATHVGEAAWRPLECLTGTGKTISLGDGKGSLGRKFQDGMLLCVAGCVCMHSAFLIVTSYDTSANEGCSHRVVGART